jgi:hypothetical protein
LGGIAGVVIFMEQFESMLASLMTPSGGPVQNLISVLSWRVGAYVTLSGFAVLAYSGLFHPRPPVWPPREVAAPS